LPAFTFGYQIDFLASQPSAGLESLSTLRKKKTVAPHCEFAITDFIIRVFTIFNLNKGESMPIV
jgi:hypothetical protein